MAGCHDWVSTVLSGESGVYVALISKSLGRDLLWFFEASEEQRWSEFSIRIPKYQFQTQENSTVFSHETQDVEEVTTFVGFCWDSQLDTLWNPVKRWVGCPKPIVERPRSKAKCIAWQCRRIRRVKRDSPGWVQCQSYGNLDHFFSQET